MSYAQVVEILGKEGTQLSHSKFLDTTTEMYEWDASGLARFAGGNMNAMFQNGRLMSKAQFGLR